jgi:hypothetical protein
MATHEVTMESPTKVVRGQDIRFEVKSDGSKLGTLLVSQGNIEWIPANASVRKRRMRWEAFAAMMGEAGRVARIRRGR